MKKTILRDVVLTLAALVGLWVGLRIGRAITTQLGRLERCETTITELELLANQTFNLSVLDSCGIITDGYGWGSCVVIGPDLVLTAGHCVDIGSWIEIGSIRYEIIEQWTSEVYDVGFVRIDGVLPYVELGQVPGLLDEVYLIGSPYDKGFVDTITKGIISHLDRDMWDWEDLIQTDAEGAPGSSGCPLFNKSGKVVGICVTGATPGGGVTLCVPATDIQSALEEYNDQAELPEN